MGTIAAWIIGIIIGAGGLWIAANFVHIPHTKYGKNGSSSVVGANNGSNLSNHTVVSSRAQVSGFPGNVPVYTPSGLALSTKSTRGNNAVVYSATYTSTQPAASITQFYKNQLSSGGWHISSQNQNGDVTTIQAARSNEQLDVLIAPLAAQSGVSAANTGFELAVTPAT